MKVEERLIFLISKVYQRLILSLKRSFLHEGLEVTPIQAMILFFLQKNNASTLTELSRGVMLENATVTGLVDRLEKLGYVERRNHPEDRRACLIYLTEKGKLVADKALPIVKKVNEEIKDGYTEAEIKAFEKVLIGAFNKFK